MLPYENAKLSIEERLEDLIRRMTLEELILQTDQYSSDAIITESRMDEQKTEDLFRGSSVGSVQVRGLEPEQMNRLQRYAVEKTRLGIPFLFSEEGVHGFSSKDCTSFPQQIGLASTFDPALGKAMGHAMAVEARAKGFHEIWSPVMDLMRDPRFGRTEEAYGEDPCLAAAFAKETVLGLQGDDLTAPDAVASEPKHYAAYGAPVSGLNCAPCAMSRHEVFVDCLPVFEAAVKEAGALNVMCSYSAVGDIPVSMDEELLTKVLREQWGMRGFVRSDMTAVSRLYDWYCTAHTPEEAMKLGLEAGVDLQLFDFTHEAWQQGVKHLVENGELDRCVVEQAARRVLRVKMLLGLFENPYVDETLAPKVVHNEEHQALAEKIARESICLLKNKDNLLPLSKDIHTIALVGPCADTAMLGDYTPGGKTGVSLLEALREKYPSINILHEKGCGFLGDRVQTIPAGVLRDEDGNPGLTARYYNSKLPQGEPVLVRTDKNVDFNWTVFKPDGEIFSKKLSDLGYSAAWSGTMVWPESFEGFLGFDGEDSVRLWVDGKLILDAWGDNRYAEKLVPFSFEAGRSYSVRMECSNDQQGARVKLGYRRAKEDISAAVEAARKAQVAIVCVGDSPETSGENFDRVSLDLSGNQLELVKAVYGTGTPVVLLMQTGRPVTCLWEQTHIPAILQCWFPGERGGYAMADTLFGDNNPGGRLPMSFPRHLGQIPCHYSRRPGGGRRYIEMGWEPLYPFGYGKSYTEFEYRDLTLSAAEIRPGESVTAYVTVANVGKRAGAAVPQLYIRDWVSSTVKPERYLAAFQRVELEPGEEKTVAISIGPKAMRTLNREYVWNVEPGKFTVYLGEDAGKLLFEQSFEVK